MTEPASLLHDTLWVKQGEQHHRSLTCARRVLHTYHHICPEAPPTGLVAPLPWTRTLDCGHMRMTVQGLEPSHTAAEWIVFPLAHPLSPSFSWSKEGQPEVHRSRSPSQTKHCFPLRNSRVGLWDSGFSGRCRITVQGGPGKAGGVIDLCSH